MGFRFVELGFEVSRSPKLQLHFPFVSGLPLRRFSEIADSRRANERDCRRLPRQLPKKCGNRHGESRRVQSSRLRGGAIRKRATTTETRLEESELIQVAQLCSG